MFDTIFGLPVHPLVVHATVVVVPAAALAVLAAALLPRFRRRAGPVPLLLAAFAVVLTPVSAQSGEALEERLGGGDLIDTHSELGEGLLPWVLLLLGGAALQYWVGRRVRAAEVSPSAGDPVPRVIAVAALVVALVTSLGTTVQVARIGHSGAQAAWSGVVESTQPGSGEVEED